MPLPSHPASVRFTPSDTTSFGRSKPRDRMPTQFFTADPWNNSRVLPTLSTNDSASPARRTRHTFRSTNLLHRLTTEPSTYFLISANFAASTEPMSQFSALYF